MTVGKLIDILKDFDPNTPVVLSDALEIPVGTFPEIGLTFDNLGDEGTSVLIIGPM
jgi:hypothetical protein